MPSDDPLVRAIFKAVNTGDLDDLKDLVDKACRIAINSQELTHNDGSLDRGFPLWADAVNDTRDAFPGISWELYDEFEVAGFGIVEDKKLTEWHQVADQATYDRWRERTGEDAVGG